MLQDVKLGLKLLWRDKAFSLTALIMLAGEAVGFVAIVMWGSLLVWQLSRRGG